jgi:hypothetical protein
MGYAKAKTADEVEVDVGFPIYVGKRKKGDSDVTIGQWRAAGRLLSLLFANLGLGVLNGAGEGGCAKQQLSDFGSVRSRRNGIRRERQMSVCTVLILSCLNNRTGRFARQRCSALYTALRFDAQSFVAKLYGCSRPKLTKVQYKLPSIGVQCQHGGTRTVLSEKISASWAVKVNCGLNNSSEKGPGEKQNGYSSESQGASRRVDANEV